MANVQYYVILKPVVTEKSMELWLTRNSFLVHPEANKTNQRSG